MAPSKSLILRAAAAGNDKRLEELLAASGDPNVCNGRRESALMLAVRSSVPGCVSLLIDAGSDINARDQFGRTALHHATESGVPLPIVEMLIANGAEIDVRCKLGRTPIIEAIIIDRIDIAQTLLDHGADPNTITIDDESPLSFAVVWHREKMIRALAKAGADVHRIDGAGWSLWDYARAEREPSLVELLNKLTKS